MTPSLKKPRKLRKDYLQRKLLHLFVNKTHYATILCFLKELKELEVSHLPSEGIIKTMEEIAEITFEESGICSINLKSTINLEARLKLAQRFLPHNPVGMLKPYQPQAIKRLKKLGQRLKLKPRPFKICKQPKSQGGNFPENWRSPCSRNLQRRGRAFSFSRGCRPRNAVDKVIGKWAPKMRHPLMSVFLP